METLDIKPLMTFSKEYLVAKNSTQLFKTSQCYNPFSVIVNNKQYELSAIHFYNKEGIVYSVSPGWFGNNNEWGHIILADNIVYRKKQNFDGIPLILSVIFSL